MYRDPYRVVRPRLLGVVLALFASSSSLAAPPRLAPEVEFFSAALPDLLSSYRAMLDALDFCSRTSAGSCGESHAMSAASIADMHYFLDRLTRFPTRSAAPSHTAQEKLKSPKQAESAFAELRDQYERKVRDFDVEFLGHFGGLLHVCEKARESSDKSGLQYEGIRQIAVERYWAIVPPDGQRTAGEIDNIGLDTIRRHSGLSKERCTATLALGKKLLGVYWRRLKPYAGDDWAELTYGDRFAASTFFTWSIALELEAHLRPDVMKEVDAREASSKAPASR